MIFPFSTIRLTKDFRKAPFIQFTRINREGKTVIPNGRYIEPAGKNIITAPHPYGLAISSDNNIAVTANSGTSPLSITIIRGLLGGKPEVQRWRQGSPASGQPLRD